MRDVTGKEEWWEEKVSGHEMNDTQMVWMYQNSFKTCGTEKEQSNGVKRTIYIICLLYSFLSKCGGGIKKWR